MGVRRASVNAKRLNPDRLVWSECRVIHARQHDPDDRSRCAGSDSAAQKSCSADFSHGRRASLSPSRALPGMNWQHCARVAFVGLFDSWESYYQAVRRCWRIRPERLVPRSTSSPYPAEGRGRRQHQRRRRRPPGR